MLIKKSIRFLILLFTIIISPIFNSDSKKSHYTSNSIYSENIKLKNYENLESLESEINLKLLPSNYFSNNNFKFMYIKYGLISEIYQVPKSARKDYKENIPSLEKAKEIVNSYVNKNEVYLVLMKTHL